MREIPKSEPQGSTLAVPTEQVKTPSFNDKTVIMTGVLEGVPVIGLHTDDVETWVIPCSVFMAMLEVYMEVYTPGDEGTLQ